MPKGVTLADEVLELNVKLIEQRVGKSYDYKLHIYGSLIQNSTTNWPTFVSWHSEKRDRTKAKSVFEKTVEDLSAGKYDTHFFPRIVLKYKIIY